MNAWIAVLLVLVLLAAGVFVLFITGLLAILLLAIGLLVFVTVLAALAIAAIAFLIAIPYYFVAKKAQTAPGAYELERVKER